MQSSSSATAKAAASAKLSSKTQAHYTHHPVVSPITDPKTEIEEISKKISEHADAIYRTWKRRGLPPSELLELYANVGSVAGQTESVAPAANEFLAAADDTTSTEGLQKLVNNFVIKDKEQRGAGTKFSPKKREFPGVPEAVAAAATAKAPVTATDKMVKQTKPAAQHSSISSPSSPTLSASSTSQLLKRSEKSEKIAGAGTGIGNAAKGGVGVAAASATAKVPTTSARASPTPTAIANVKSGGNSASAKIVKIAETSQSQSQKQRPQSPKYDHKTEVAKSSLYQNHPKSNHTIGVAGGVGDGKINQINSNGVARPTTTTTVSKSKMPVLDVNLELNLLDLKHTPGLDLKLDVKNLSELQAQNLLKIKELLHDNTETTKVKKKQGASNRAEDAKKPVPTAAATATATTKTATAIKSAAGTPITSSSLAVTTTSDTKTVKSNVKGDSKKTANANFKLNSGDAVDAPATKTPIVTSPVSRSIAAAVAAATATATTVTAPVAAAPIVIGTDKMDKSHSDKSASGGSKRSATTTKMTKSHARAAATTADNQQQSQQTQLQQSHNYVNVDKKTRDDEKVPKSGSKTVKSASSNNSVGNAKVAAVTTTITTAASAPTTTTPTTNTTAASPVATAALTKEKKDTTKSANASGTVGAENGMEVARTSMPTPTKFKSGSRSSLANGSDKNLGRPILTRGSVAERVLMFEKCPDARNSFLNIKRPDPQDAPPKSLLKVKLHSTPPPPPDQNSVQREFRTNKSVYIPRFYFPHGKPQPQIAVERTLRNILSAFDSFPNNQVTKDELPRILKLCGIPYYWRMPVMVFCQQGNSGLVERTRFVEFWKQMNVYCHEDASRFIYILSRGQRFRNYIVPDDLVPLVQDVVDTHPGLAFLKEATEFHSRYVHTVIARIFYSVNRSWSGKITLSELKKSDLLEIISLLEEEDDINQIMAFFSYEHFYVIYCKFWELDKDHDLLINQEDLARHSDHALSTRIVERIFSGCVTRSDNKKSPDDEPKMSYTDFVWFLLSEEDKRTPTAIEYWFRCMDLDGDGVLSMYELEYFYEEQQHRMESIGIETLPFEDCLCQMLDMIKPQRRDCITLSDLKRCKMTHVFFDTFFNLEKYLDHEQRDPFASQRDEFSSDWERFAAQEYELLITEEND